MVRATYARVKVRLGGGDPSGWSQAKIEGLCTQADYILDGYTTPDTLSTTDNNAIEIAVDVVLRMMRQADMLQESSGTTGHDGRTYVDIPTLSDEIKERIDRVLRSEYFGIQAIDMVGEDT